MDKAKEFATGTMHSAGEQAPSSKPRLAEKMIGPQAFGLSQANSVRPAQSIGPLLAPTDIRHSKAIAFGAPERARASKAMQRSVGNARFNRMQESDPAPEYQASTQDVVAIARSPLTASTPSAIPAPVTSTLATAQGAPLPDSHRWSQRINADVSSTRIVTGEGAADAASSIDARAFTVGNRVFFGSGYGPTSEGGRLLAHELHHVAQQQAAPAPSSWKQLPFVPDGDKREVEARGHEASRPSTGEQAIARDGEKDVDAASYRKLFAKEIGEEIVFYLATNDIPTGSRFVTFLGPLASGPAIVEVTGADLESKLDEWLGRDRVNSLVNKARPMGREQLTDGDKTWVADKWSAGPARWFPDVAVEIAASLAMLMRRSLDRIVPRYQSAAVAVGIAAEEKSHQSLADPPEPNAGDIIPGHPFDQVAIKALLAHSHFDYPNYRTTYPKESGKVGELKPVSVSWATPGNGTYWARVSPKDATEEDVANELFGSPMRADELVVVAPPLFGFNNATILLQKHQDELTRMGAAIQLTGDAVKEATSGPLADEIAKNQGALHVTKAATKGAVLQMIDESIAIVPTIEKSGLKFGMGRNPTVSSLAPLTKRLNERRAKIGASTEEDALTWAGQAEAQQEILTSVAFGFDRESNRLADLTKMVTDATVKLGAFNLPDHVREAMNHVAMRYADAALVSDAPATAATKLAEVEDEAGALPITFLEGTLASIQRTLDDARNAKHDKTEHATYDVGGMASREQQLKSRLAALRAMVRTDPERATKELGEIAKLIGNLQVETEIVGNMDQLDAAWQALDDGISFWWTSGWTQLRASILKDRGDAYHRRWKAVFNRWKSGDTKKQDEAKRDFDALRADEGLRKWFGEVQATLKSAEIERLIGQIAVMIAITVVTMGVGDLVLAGAAGWELSAGATAVAVGGAEAATFTLLSQIFLDSDHTLGHVVYEFGTNWAIFGVMRRFQLLAEVAKLGKVSAVGGNVLILAATTYAKADLDKYIREGRHLNGEEVKMIALQGMAMAIAMHANRPEDQAVLCGARGRRIRVHEQAQGQQPTAGDAHRQGRSSQRHAGLQPGASVRLEGEGVARGALEDSR